jgi:endonuclease/exonuclease/phosphatase family metal-dependent hydrolase
MGDFNFRPSSPQYTVATNTLVDAWTAGGGQPLPPGLDPERRIDHIFVSPSVEVESARYLPADASDHPPLLASLRCPGDG